MGEVSTTVDDLVYLVGLKEAEIFALKRRILELEAERDDYLLGNLLEPARIGGSAGFDEHGPAGTG